MNYKDAEMPVPHSSVTIWFVRSHWDVCYPTKIVAEAAARAIYPGQDTNSNVVFKLAQLENWG